VRKTARILASACIAAAALVAPPGAAQADPGMVCPDNFQPFPLDIAPPDTDKNGNFIVCAKETNGTVIFRDDLLKTDG
jgi:hypothetical protein